MTHTHIHAHRYLYYHFRCPSRRERMNGFCSTAYLIFNKLPGCYRCHHIAYFRAIIAIIIMTMKWRRGNICQKKKKKHSPSPTPFHCSFRSVGNVVKKSRKTFRCYKIWQCRGHACNRTTRRHPHLSPIKAAEHIPLCDGKNPWANKDNPHASNDQNIQC